MLLNIYYGWTEGNDVHTNTREHECMRMQTRVCIEYQASDVTPRDCRVRQYHSAQELDPRLVYCFLKYRDCQFPFSLFAYSNTFFESNCILYPLPDFPRDIALVLWSMFWMCAEWYGRSNKSSRRFSNTNSTTLTTEVSTTPRLSRFSSRWSSCAICVRNLTLLPGLPVFTSPRQWPTIENMFKVFTSVNSYLNAGPVMGIPQEKVKQGWCRSGLSCFTTVSSGHGDYMWIYEYIYMNT